MADDTFSMPLGTSHSLWSTTSILPVEDVFSDLVDTLQRAVVLETASHHGRFGDEAKQVSTAFVDAARVQVRGLAKIALALKALTPQCVQVQQIAGLVLAVLENRDTGAVRIAVDAAHRRGRDLRGSDARSRRTGVLIDEALRLVAVVAPDRRRICAHPSIVASAA